MASAEVADSWCAVAAELDGAGLTARFRQLEAERRNAEAEMAAVLAEVDRREIFRDDAHSSVKGWARALGLWSNAEAIARTKLARLCTALPAVGEALSTGVLGAAQALELGRVYANPRVRHQMADVVDIFLTHAGSMPFESFHSMVHQWESMIDADGAHRDHEMSHRNRRASLHCGDTATSVNALGGNLQGAQMNEVFERYKDAEFRTDWDAAKAIHGDSTSAAHLARTPQQRSFDALFHMFLDAASTAPDAKAPEPVLNIVADIHTFTDALADFARLLANVDDVDPTSTLGGFLRNLPTTGPTTASQSGSAGKGSDPRWWRCATVDGVPVPRSVLIEALLLGHVRRAVINSAGVVTDMGRKQRFFTGPLRDALMLLTDQCVWSGCSRTSRESQADHIHDHAHGGPTSTANGGPLCGFHNRAKNRRYRVQRDTNGYWHTFRPDGTEIT